MTATEQPASPAPLAGVERRKSRGEACEGLAFTLCKAGTLVLLTGKYALPLISGGAAILFLLAHLYGQRESRCLLRRPLLIATFWGLVCLAWCTGSLWGLAAERALRALASPFLGRG